MTEDTNKQKTEASGGGRRALIQFLGVVIAVFAVSALMANATRNRALYIDTSDDFAGQAEDIQEEVTELFEAMESDAFAIAEDLPAADSDAQALQTYLAETLDDDVAEYVNRVGLYRSDQTALVLDITFIEDSPDGEAPFEASADEISAEAASGFVDQTLLADVESESEAIWTRDDGARLIVPVESEDAGFAAVWMDVSDESLTALVNYAAARERFFEDAETTYAILVTEDYEVIAHYNASSASQEQITTLADRLSEDNLSEDGYYEVEQDPIIDEAAFVSTYDVGFIGWQVVSGYPMSKVPTANILESTLNLFEVSQVGGTISQSVEVGVDYLNQNLSWFFRGLRWPIEQAILAVEGALKAVPWIVVIGLTAALAWFIAGPKTTYIATFGMFIIGMIGLWDRTMTTLAMLLTAMAFCVVVGIPLGIWAAKDDRVNEIVRSVLDAMQTIHPFVYLVPIVVLFGIGKVPGTIATIIFALPPMVRLTNLGIRQVPEDVIEAARAFGSSDWQLLRDVQLPLALPSIMAGVNQTLMLSLSMVVIVALIAGRGLGEEIYRAIGRADTGRAVVAGVAVLLLAVVVDRVSQGGSNPRKAEEE